MLMMLIGLWFSLLLFGRIIFLFCVFSVLMNDDRWLILLLVCILYDIVVGVFILVVIVLVRFCCCLCVLDKSLFSSVKCLVFDVMENLLNVVFVVVMV